MDPHHADCGSLRPLKPVQAGSIREAGRDAFVLGFPVQHPFLPGQVLAVTLDRAIPPRLFSICSGSGEPEVSILFNVKHGGLLSPRLAAVKAGDRLLVSEPFGTFTGDDKPAWWIAAGTGIAPYRSMLRSGLGAGNMLIHGARTADRFHFEAEMKAALGDRYVRCCSQGGGEDGVYPGRITQWLRDRLELPAGQRYYLCGSAEMVVEVRDILLGRGIGIDNILAEIYF